MENNIYDLSGEYGIGYTNNCNSDGINYFYFDLDDYQKICDYQWYFNGHGYLQAKGKDENNKYSVRLHRIITQAEYGAEVDHINHDKFDNRKCNLRICTHKQNCRNRKSTGVCFDKHSGKYQSYIVVDGKKHHLGCYMVFNDAIQARKEAEEKYFGEYSFGNSNKEIINNEVSN